MVILIIGFVIVLIFIYTSSKEYFEVMPYNFNLKTITPVTQTDYPNFEIINNGRTKPEDTNYKLYLDKVFHWNNSFKTFLTNLFKNTKMDIKIFREIYNIKYKGTEISRQYVFNLDIIHNNSSPYKLKIFLTVNNINKYIDDTGEYNKVFELISSDIDVQYIEIDIPKSQVFVKPIDQYDNYNEVILNKLYLMGPFPTSNKTIETQQKNNISKKLDSEDKLPRYDFQCPFYRANKNYPNNFGKVDSINNVCELPLNAQSNDFNTTNPEFVPYCYNCEESKRISGQGTLGVCCEDQFNKIMYPNLISPDYAFFTDKELREKYKDVLLLKNLQVN
jgi:hypothetical protein